MILEVFTDGGASPNNSSGTGGWAAIIPQQGNLSKTYRVWGGEFPSTNNAMEIMAGVKILDFIKEHNLVEGFDSILIYSDSAYHVKGANLWAAKWKANKWVTGEKTEVKNLDLWKAIIKHKETFSVPIEWKWVKAHVGNRYNEECDELVKKAIQEQKKL